MLEKHAWKEDPQAPVKVLSPKVDRQMGAEGKATVRFTERSLSRSEPS
jgi:hypothetical protein